MKKIYERPEISVEMISNQDIITVSGGLVLGKFTITSEANDNVVNY